MNDLSLITSAALARLPVGPAVQAPPNGQPDAAAVAGDFESIFLSHVLRTMRESSGEEGLFAGDSSDTLGGLFDLYMSQHLAAGSPLGLGSWIQSLVPPESSP